MIAYLEGTLREKSPTRCVVACNGVGYGVRVPASTYAKLPAEGGKALLHIHTHVRENAIELFGFSTFNEQQVFELLLEVSGIGPRVALNTLSGISAEDLLRAVSSADVTRLSKIPGVGKKTAEKMVFELKDKLPRIAAEAGLPRPSGPLEDLVSALVNLGYKQSHAEAAAQKVLEEIGKDASFDQLFRAALKGMGK